MNTIVGLIVLALTVGLAIMLILSFGPVKRAIGLGNVEPSGIPAAVGGIGK